MYVLFIIILSLIIPTSYAQANGAQRCSVRDCLCLVTPGSPPGARTTTSPERRRFQVFFNENSHELSSEQTASLRELAERFEGSRNMSISLIGYTDGCGSSEHNNALSGRRTATVSSVVRDVLPSANIRHISHGENSPNHLAEARRVDIVIHTERRLTTAIERVPADVYLIDASGSMWQGWREWQDVINASVRPGSRVYLSIMTGCRGGQRLSTVRPQSGTEIWYSYWKVIDYMNPGETLAIISDFDSNVPLTRRESEIIRRKVSEAQIEVVIIR